MEHVAGFATSGRTAVVIASLCTTAQGLMIVRPSGTAAASEDMGWSPVMRTAGSSPVAVVTPSHARGINPRAVRRPAQSRVGEEPLGIASACNGQCSVVTCAQAHSTPFHGDVAIWAAESDAGASRLLCH